MAFGLAVGRVALSAVAPEVPTVLVGLVVGVRIAIAGLIFGSVVGMVPAVIFALTFAPLRFLIIDQNMGILESFSMSYRVT